MFKFFKKEKNTEQATVQEFSFELELTAAVLAYEVARSDGQISDDELSVLMLEIEKISNKVGRDKNEILNIVDTTVKTVFLLRIHRRY